MKVSKKFIPSLKRFAHFTNREAMRKGHPTHTFNLHHKVALPPATLPIDWAKSLTFPMDDNDSLGDCMVAAAEHADNTWTGNSSTESTFDNATTKTWYENLSGGDNGLDEGTLVGGWKKGLNNIPAACILDALDIDPTNAPLVQSAIELFGGVLFMFSVPDAWINSFTTGGVWDAPATPDPQNGHGTWWNGVDASGRYKLQTWGSWTWITPAAVAEVSPSAFVPFSMRWFNAQGYAPNGKHYTELSALWTAAGGMTLPPWTGPTPTPTPVPPGPTPTPTPTPVPPAPTPTPALFHFSLNRAVRAGQRVMLKAPVAMAAGTYSVSHSPAAEAEIKADVE